MRVLVIADLHYSLPQFDWVVNTAQDFDFVVLAGDHLDLSSHVDCRAQSAVVTKYFELLRQRTKVIICSGNHDLDSRGPLGEKVAKWIRDCNLQSVLTDGKSLICEDTLITVCPWWDGPESRRQVAEQLAADSLRRSDKWLWIHHAPPDGSPTSWAGNRSLGDRALLEWINQYQPDFVFSGHVHQSPFVKGGSWVDNIGKTWVFNAGHQFGAPPAFIVFDTEHSEVFWMSAAGIQSVNLRQPLDGPPAKLMAPPGWFTFRDQVAGRTPG